MLTRDELIDKKTKLKKLISSKAHGDPRWNYLEQAWRKQLELTEIKINPLIL